MAMCPINPANAVLKFYCSSCAPPISQASCFSLIYSPKVPFPALKCLLTTGIKHNCQLGVEVKAPNSLV